MNVGSVHGARRLAAPEGLDTLEAASRARGEVAPGEALLPEPLPGSRMTSDPGAELAILVLESAKEDKAFGRVMRASEEAASRAAEAAQLDAMGEKADRACFAGIVGGFAMVASSALGMAATGAGAANAKQQSLGLEATAKATEGSGKMVSTLLQRGADLAQVDATQCEQLVGRHRRAAEEARETVTDAKALVDRTIGFYREYMSAKTEAQRAAILRA